MKFRTTLVTGALSGSFVLAAWMAACSSTTRGQVADGGDAGGGAGMPGEPPSTSAGGGVSTASGGSGAGEGGSSTEGTGGSGVSSGGAAASSSAGGTTAASGGASGGSGGSGGNGGSGGSGGSPVVECEDAGDCADADACNGAESCVDGVCQPGERDAACTGMDEDHCECVWLDEACAVRGLDRDSDDHRSAACADDAEADDCNDDCAACYPGAEEICDGADNDCDGAVDIFDGLGLSGQTEALLAVGTAMRTAWWPAANRYATLIQNTEASSKLDLFLIDPDGSVALGPIDVTEESGTYLLGEMDASGDTLGLLLVNTFRDEPPFLLRYDVDGNALGMTPIVPSLDHGTGSFGVGMLVAEPSGGWHAVYTFITSGTTSGYLTRFTAAGVHSGSPTGLGLTDQLRGAHTDSQVVLSSFATGASRLLSVGGSGVILDAREDVEDIRALGANATGFAWQRGPNDTPSFAEFDQDLQVTCGPVPVSANSNGVRIGHSAGLWVTYAAPVGVPGVEIIEAGCGQTRHIPLASSDVYGGAYGSLAAGEKGVLFVWRTPSQGIGYRAVGPRLCDTPLD